MRPSLFAALLLVAVLACTEPDTELLPAEVNWMEWPAEILAATPFTVRIVGYAAACREVLKFDPGSSIDNSAVTFAPFFLVSKREAPCPLERAAHPIDQVIPIIAPFFDTRAPVPGLVAQYPRTYEIRAASEVSMRLEALASRLPVRTFGEIAVRSDTANATRANAGGLVFAYRDSTGCVEITPVGIYQGYVLENPPADTASYWSAFVRGYLYKPAAPPCGSSRVFHLVSRN